MTSATPGLQIVLVVIPLAILLSAIGIYVSPLRRKILWFIASVIIIPPLVWALAIFIIYALLGVLS